MPPATSSPHLWPFDLETCMRVASEVRNLHSKFGPLGSRIIRCVRDGHLRWGTFIPNLGFWVLELLAVYATDRWTDKSNTYCTIPTGRGVIISSQHNDNQVNHTRHVTVTEKYYCIIIIITTMFIVLSSWQSHCESSPGSFDECRIAPRPSQTT